MRMRTHLKSNFTGNLSFSEEKKTQSTTWNKLTSITTINKYDENGK